MDIGDRVRLKKNWKEIVIANPEYYNSNPEKDCWFGLEEESMREIISSHKGCIDEICYSAPDPILSLARFSMFCIPIDWLELDNEEIPSESNEIRLDIPDDILLKLCLEAHKKNITLNAYINDILRKYMGENKNILKYS